MSRRSVLASSALALVLTLAGACVPGRATATYPEIMGCERACEVAAVGFPVPFIVDYPGLSPANSAGPVGAILGLDRVLWGRATMALAFWAAVSVAIVGAVGRAVCARRAG